MDQETYLKAMVRAYIRKDHKGNHRIFVRRGKFKHLFELGKHNPTDNAFYSSLRDGSIAFDKEIKECHTLFDR